MARRKGLSMARKVNEQAEIKITELQVLKGARELLSDESKWAKGFFAFDKDGERCGACSPEACKFCLIGAMRKVAGRDTSVTVNCLTEIYNYLGHNLAADWNDDADRKHSEVIDLLNKTIARLESVT